MIFRNLIFEAEIVEQRLRAGMVSHHERQASKRCSEQQHRWPAYNVNVAPLQALTERLFQHTQAISQLCALASHSCDKHAAFWAFLPRESEHSSLRDDVSA